MYWETACWSDFKTFKLWTNVLFRGFKNSVCGQSSLIMFSSQGTLQQERENNLMRGRSTSSRRKRKSMFVCFSWVIALARLPVLSWIEVARMGIFVLSLMIKEVFSFSPLTMMVTVDLSCIALYWNRLYLYPYFESFYHNGCWILLNSVSSFVEMGFFQNHLFC